MTATQPYPPGSFFLTKISGPTGWWVGLAQALVGIPSRWTHAGIVGYEGETYEAAPGGVVKGTVDDLLTRPHVVCDAAVQQEIERRLTAWRTRWPGATRNSQAEETARNITTRAVRLRVVQHAHRLLGTPYSFLDYLALGLHHLLPGARVTAWARDRVQDSGHLICSAYVDRVYDHAGIHLYDDGRLSGDVTPSDLDGWAQSHGHLLSLAVTA